MLLYLPTQKYHYFLSHQMKIAITNLSMLTPTLELQIVHLFPTRAGMATKLLFLVKKRTQGQPRLGPVVFLVIYGQTMILGFRRSGDSRLLQFLKKNLKSCRMLLTVMMD
uniref:eIF4-gamma/eIF5/eIF2-epsilon domain-containing protein n=1 Tax=Arundo donax TaxID=35708 RepID=A0A0A9CM02_ARUDO